MHVVSNGCRYDSDVNIADRWNGTPLMAALRNGHLAIAKMLMSCEATLGDNADPALVQVSCVLLAGTLRIRLPVMPQSGNLRMYNVSERVLPKNETSVCIC